MTRTSTATAPTGYGIGANETKELHEVVTCHCVAASTAIVAGQFVAISTSANTITACSATNGTFDGIALNSYDNSAVAAATTERKVSVLRRGITYVDAVVDSDANQSSITYNDLVYLTAAVGSTAAAGQAVSMYSGGSATMVGRCFDLVTGTTTAALYKVSVYIDTLSKATML